MFNGSPRCSKKTKIILFLDTLQDFAAHRENSTAHLSIAAHRLRNTALEQCFPPKIFVLATFVGLWPHLSLEVNTNPIVHRHI